jgi:hypothetical protein
VSSPHLAEAREGRGETVAAGIMGGDMIARLSVLAVCAAVAAQGGAAAARPSPVLVTYEQTGGFASIERGLTVRQSGAVVSDGLPLKVKHLTPARLRTLRTALADAHFATLHSHYASDEPIADGFVYRITYAGRTVSIDQGATLPARLEHVFALLRSLTY